MKKLLVIICFLIGAATFAQTDYEKGMQKAFDLWEEGKNMEASNLFERIANAEKDNWLPSFYGAQVLIFKAFDEKDKEKLTTILNRALNLLNMAKTFSPENNVEIMVAEAQYYSAWIAFDGMTYGMKYAGKVVSLYQKASILAPDNPRVVMGKAEWDMGSAQFMGGDPSDYCKDVERAIVLFGTFEPETEFHPSGGLDRAKEVLERTCKK
ncbi:hypothetical protein [Patiriisocius sp. Uisw_017]|jgi:hypothetical protein|uniref:hypothetical protein n=1 Tax=Patiriisocius sp. Uisw_017 TaxID=3230968 RepID=UPI0039EBA356